MLRRLSSIIKIILVNVILLVIGLEIIGLGLFSFENGKLYYTSAKGPKTPVNKRKIKVLDAVFHPFFGYVHRQNPDWANNEGHGHPFITKSENCCDIPLIPENNQIVIGVFGGSVAREFGSYNRKYGEFQNLLETKYPQFKDKKITIWNFSMSGYRQPQQLMMLTYYVTMGQHFDAIINIDGYNEVYHGMLNAERGIELSFPGADVWGGMHTHLERLNMRFDDHTGVSSVYYESLHRSLIKEAALCTMASCYLVKRTLAEISKSKAKRIKATFENRWEKVSHFIRLIPDPENPGGESRKRNFKDPDKWYEYIANYWANASLLMQNICDRNGIMYFHLLQPNLHYKTKRKFPIKNRNNWTVKFTDPVVKGYPKLIEKAEYLKKNGVNIYFPMELFDDAKTDEIYMDDCCHYTDAGNKILTNYMAKQFDQSWKNLKNRELLHKKNSVNGTLTWPKL
ncbi:MAG: hypothetical protein CMM44_07595 [Rhodospirillaceae bacterium]|nr:hypothetical protein [Rhodospirillaceae bacterium]|tara:strand:- start:9060 stop:10421 length:1362 start_codon:yes stop_codon:yes gene_type:complete